MSDVLGSFWQSVVMEARKKNEDEDSTDYTEDEPDIEDTGNDAGDEPETEDEGSTDYTVEDDEIGDDDDGEDSTDYTADNPDDDTGDDTTTINAGEPDEPADEGDNPDTGNNSTDYSAGADDGLSLDDDGGDADNAGDDGNSDDAGNGDDSGGDGDEPTLDTGEGDSTDYTAGTDDTGEDSGENDSGGEDDSSDDSSSDDSSGGDDSPKNDKLRKYYLLKDFGNLQTFIQDGIDKLTEKKRESFLDKQVDMQCVSNFNRLLNAISDYMIFKFDEDDYVTALYNYKRFMVLVNMNIALLEKRKENAERISKGAKKTPETK